MTNNYDSIMEADVIMVIGSNTTETHPVIASWFKECRKNRKSKLIVCDPICIPLADDADFYLQHLSGSDTALLNGLMHVIIKEELYDKDFIENNADGFEELKTIVSEYDPERVSKLTGINKDIITSVARIYANGPNSAIFYTMGITQHCHGTNNVRSIANLALLCGMFGRPGTGVNPLRGQNNVQGACDVGALPEVFPGYQKALDKNVIKHFEEAWNSSLPSSQGKTIVKITEAINHSGIKGLFIMGENPLVSDPHTEHVKEALKKLDILVVQDLFLTETASMADVVLPAACWAEKDGTFTNTCRSVLRVRKAVEPPGEAKADWEILLELAKACGADWKFNSPSEIMNEINKLVPQYGGITYKRLENEIISWPCIDENHPGTPNLYTNGFPRKKALFKPVDYREPHEWPDENYPFLAITGRLRFHYHSGTMTRRSKTKDLVNFLEIDMNPKDSEKLKLKEGDLIKVTSRRGSVTGQVKISQRLKEGTVFLPFHFGEAPANAITALAWDETTETPAYKISAVALEKL